MAWMTEALQEAVDIARTIPVGSLLVIPFKRVDENLQHAGNRKLDRDFFQPALFEQDQASRLGRGRRRRARREPFAPALRIARRHRVTPNDFSGLTSHRWY